ncbi:YqgE/AlgH family protein [Alysiella filiformis]|uniref:UPF0301 protein SAMN02746062_01797 n=1 Tax=Alysiella filiformis DSM 16848 TaxID=1120981 RepID=A0A286EFL2_9NEIS|nr:YqgE/AlgH family protein [Alysiella filiformis]QMT30643.1 YqgE/AlgH family protein [Alysiella filiformis]UBQ56379.1 YqgE/AlgH family protein [Alysiella filiformis DSM 16848]SOD69687.1 putative transcriptional regulator [Alysiella filiformis DSM 16848]
MNLTHHFLIATPNLADSLFSGSVVYVCEHNENGAMGIIINKPSPIGMEVVFASSGNRIPERFIDHFVMMGGPVQVDRGFVVHTPIGNWQSTLSITDDTAISTSRDVIESLAKDERINKAILSIGYSSWTKGQLEREIAENAWLVAPADSHILFDTPIEEKHGAALSKLGINAVNLMNGVGYA